MIIWGMIKRWFLVVIIVQFGLFFLFFSFSSFKGTVSRMSTSQDQNGSSSREPLLRCCDARRDLELAIGGVLRAEQQIKDNLREV